MELTIPFFIRGSVVLTFTALLGYWSMAAIKRYHDQPVATYVTYTQGDDNVNLVYPQLTFQWLNMNCQLLDVPCSIGTSRRFGNIIFKCLQDPSFNLDEYLEKLRMKMMGWMRLAFPLDVDFNASIRLVRCAAAGTLWLDPCLNFDPNQLRVKVDRPYTFELNFKRTDLQVFWHTSYDFPDACNLHLCPSFEFPNVGRYYKLRKRMIQRVSTRKEPCGPFSKETCFDVKAYQMVVDEFKCKAPIFYSGQHLDKNIEGFEKLPKCNNSEVLAALGFGSKINTTKLHEHCKHEMQCNRVKWQLDEKVYNWTWTGYGGFTNVLEMTYGEDFEVEHSTTYISYDLQSLIGELGGVIGMFLGFSGLSLGFSFADYIERLLGYFMKAKSAKSIKRKRARVSTFKVKK